MIVLGINETRCATAAVLRDGRVVGCASEERFTRLKNDAGYPRLAIDALLEECGLTPADVDVVALAGARAASREWLNRVLHDETYAREYYGVSLPSPWRALGRRARKLGAKLGLANPSRGKFGISQGERLGFVTDHLGIPKDRIICLDHHTCHAAAAYFGSGFAGKDALVLTNDNSGDGLCATASTGRGVELTRHEAAPSAPGSLGAFYSFVALGGGCFMNVKANMLLGQEEWVEELFAFPSCGDESNAVGAAYLAYLQECAKRGVTGRVEPFGPAYLGNRVTDEDAEAVIRARGLEGRYKIAFQDRIEEKIAELLVSDGVVARCAGRMEFGARALGNRSILANPSDHRVVPLINRMIKNRDFRMAFAPTLLAARAAADLVQPKGLDSPYMMLAMPTRPEAREALVAAVHPQDGTARPQILERTWNPEYHAVIAEFERRTGIGAVLNTSFNLHGEPVVCSAGDAVDTFERSGLPHLAVGHWLISKK